jgi:serine/threonine protein kinase
VNKTKVYLNTKNLYDINKSGAGKYFHEKKKLCQSDFYLPPEEAFSKQGDVWSLGILLH